MQARGYIEDIADTCEAVEGSDEEGLAPQMGVTSSRKLILRRLEIVLDVAGSCEGQTMRQRSS